MSLIKAEELATSGIDCSHASELIYRGKLLVRQNTFPTSARQEAVAMCEKHLMAGQYCILVIHTDKLTLWLEQKNINPQTGKISKVKIKKPPLLFRGRKLE